MGSFKSRGWQIDNNDSILVIGEKGSLDLGSKLAKCLPSGTQVGLVGDLGAGKTTIVRGILGALAPSEDVSSPSYVLCHEYSTGDGIVEHWDLYRLTELPEELLFIQPNVLLRLIEWPNKIEGYQRELSLILEIKNSSGSDRLISFSGAEASTVLQSLTAFES